MNGLQTAQRIFDRRLPEDVRERVEREFEHPEEAPAGANVIRSVKFIELPTAKASSEREQKSART